MCDIIMVVWVTLVIHPKIGLKVGWLRVMIIRPRQPYILIIIS